MCGRFTSKAEPKEIEKEFQVKINQDTLFNPRYNIAPTQSVSMKAIDEINQKFGKDTIRFASVKSESSWKIKQTRKSQSYTTNWNELLMAH